MMNRFFRAWRELTRSAPSQKFYTGNTLSGLWGGWNPVDNSSHDLTRTVQGATFAYLYAPPVKACVDVIAVNGASVPLVIQDADGNDIARSDENPADSPVLMAIERSWKYHNQNLIRLWLSSYLLYGMTFLEKRTNMSGFGMDLKWLNPNSVDIQAPFGVVQSYRYNGAGQVVVYEPDEILYAKMFNPNDDVFGYSPTLNIMASVNATIHFGKFKGSYYNNAGQPGFAFIPEYDVSDAELRRLRDFWQHDLRGVENFFKTLISPVRGALTQFDPIDISKPLEINKEDERRILKGYGVPPEMIGDTEGNPYQFSPEKKNAFMQTVVAPAAKSVADAINYEGFRFLDPDGYRRGYRFAFDFSAYDTISESKLKEQQNVRDNYRSGGLSYGDYRAAIGYPLGKSEQQLMGDLYYIPGVDTPVPRDEIRNLWKYKLIVAPSVFNSQEVTGKPLPQPVNPDEVVLTGDPDSPEAEPLSGSEQPTPQRAAPENTTFSSVTYNGVTVQASPVRPSDRDDKKYMRWVRYKGDERIVHWGQPGEQMERDNPEARENFNSRHQCSTKKDPFAPGFWACWAWQPSAEIPGSKAVPTDNSQSYAILGYFSDNQRIKQAQDVLRGLMGDKVEYTEPKTFHVTLLYSEDARLYQIQDSLPLNPAAFSVSVDGVGVFDTPDGYAIHLTIREGTIFSVQSALADTATSNNVGISQYSIPSNYKPHITLGYSKESIETFDIEPFALMVNRIEVSGSNHEPIISQNLKAMLPTLDDLQAIATKYHIPLGDTLNYFEEWQRVS